MLAYSMCMATTEKPARVRRAPGDYAMLKLKTLSCCFLFVVVH